MHRIKSHPGQESSQNWTKPRTWTVSPPALFPFHYETFPIHFFLKKAQGFDLKTLDATCNQNVPCTCSIWMSNMRSWEKEEPGQGAVMKHWKTSLFSSLNWGDWWLLSSCTPWSLSQQQQKHAGRETGWGAHSKTLCPSACLTGAATLCKPSDRLEQHKREAAALWAAGDSKNQTKPRNHTPTGDFFKNYESCSCADGCKDPTCAQRMAECCDPSEEKVLSCYFNFVNHL